MGMNRVSSLNDMDLRCDGFTHFNNSNKIFDADFITFTIENISCFKNACQNLGII